MKSQSSLLRHSKYKVRSLALPIPINLEIGIPIIETKVSIDGQANKFARLVVDLGHRNALILNLDGEKGIRAPANIIRSLAGRGIQGTTRKFG